MVGDGARGVSFLQPFQLEHTVQQFGVHMLQQVDLTKEASNLRKFKDCFSLWPAVSFPTPVQGLATEEVLIETFEDGVSISNFLMDPLPAEAMDELIRRHEAEERAVGGLNITGITGGVGGGRGTPGSDKVEEAEAKAAAAQAYADAVRVPEENKVLAALGVRTLLKMLIDDNFLHADLHRGTSSCVCEEVWLTACERRATRVRRRGEGRARRGFVRPGEGRRRDGRHRGRVEPRDARDQTRDRDPRHGSGDGADASPAGRVG